MDATVVIDALEQQHRLGILGNEHAVARFVRISGLDGAAECGAPKLGSSVEVVDLAVDHERGQSASVHAASFLGIAPRTMALPEQMFRSRIRACWCRG
jgi:hypothetical protein